MTDNRPVADGIVEKGPDGSTQVRFVRRLPHPIDRVWAALTDPAELRGWWGDADLDLADGGRFALRWFNTDEDGNVATLDGAITKLDPPRLLEISAAWGSTGSNDPGAPTTLTWELDRDGDQTLLRFKHRHPAHRRHQHRPRHRRPEHRRRQRRPHGRRHPHRRRLAHAPRRPGRHPLRRRRRPRPPRTRLRTDPRGLRREVRPPPE
jgi:uncharacterized protein YndB with AHSA1/START domain